MYCTQSSIRGFALTSRLQAVDRLQLQKAADSPLRSPIRAAKLRKLARGALRRPGMTVALSVIVCYAVLALLAPWISSTILGTTPEAINPRAGLERPSLTHPLGTDELGRDQLSRIL